jgi:hypothetical protein
MQRPGDLGGGSQKPGSRAGGYRGGNRMKAASDPVAATTGAA